ncbi:MAG: hypothetical protein ACTHLR_11470 [Rhizomicrobium sp.]
MTLIFAPVLGLSAILSALFAARASRSARDYLRFAAALYLALGLCMEASVFLARGEAFVLSVMFFVCALAPAALALALFASFEHRPSSILATILLALCACAGVVAAATGTTLFCFAPLLASGLVMLALCARQWRRDKRSSLYAALSAGCMILGAAAVHGDGAGEVALALFSSASLLGLGLALARRSEPAVVHARDLRGAVTIGGEG